MSVQDDRDRRIVADRKAGMTYTAMEAQYGITRERCRQICKAAGIKTKYKRQTKHVYPPKPHLSMLRPRTREDVAEWLDMWSATFRQDGMNDGDAIVIAMRVYGPEFSGINLSVSPTRVARDWLAAHPAEAGYRKGMNKLRLFNQRTADEDETGD